MTDNNTKSQFCLDHEQVSALRDLESITQQSVSEMIRESIDLYIRVKKGRVAEPLQTETMLSPIVFEMPYRKTTGQ